jgi:hypothetical protein
MSEPLKPLGPEWIKPSITGVCDFGLCRDEDGKLFLCTLEGEAEGWKKFRPADELIVSAFLICQEAEEDDRSCFACRAPLMGGRTQHAADCPIRKLIDDFNRKMAG